MILKEYHAVAVVTKLVSILLTDKLCVLISVFFFFGGGIFQLTDYIQLNNINLKLKTVRGDSGCCYKSCCTRVPLYIVYQQIKDTSHYIVPNYC